jgi:hypothetical protein
MVSRSYMLPRVIYCPYLIYFDKIGLLLQCRPSAVLNSSNYIFLNQIAFKSALLLLLFNLHNSNEHQQEKRKLALGKMYDDKAIYILLVVGATIFSVNGCALFSEDTENALVSLCMCVCLQISHFASRVQGNNKLFSYI